MEHTVYSFDPRVAELGDFDRDTRSRHFSPERRAAVWQHEDGDDDSNRQVADIMSATRPLTMQL